MTPTTKAKIMTLLRAKWAEGRNAESFDTVRALYDLHLDMLEDELAMQVLRDLLDAGAERITSSDIRLAHAELALKAEDASLPTAEEAWQEMRDAALEQEFLHFHFVASGFTQTRRNPAYLCKHPFLEECWDLIGCRREVLAYLEGDTRSVIRSQFLRAYREKVTERIQTVARAIDKETLAGAKRLYPVLFASRRRSLSPAPLKRIAEAPLIPPPPEIRAALETMGVLEPEHFDAVHKVQDRKRRR